MRIKGRVWKFGSNVDTDVIIPARYLDTTDRAELAKHCMEGLDPDFGGKVADGDIIVAEKNFGCGSSREHAPISIKAAGISCVIATSFARIFYRNSFNMGLLIFECPDAVEGIQEGHEIEVDPESGKIVNLSTGKTFQAEPIPDFMRELLETGGLMNWVKDKTGLSA